VKRLTNYFDFSYISDKIRGKSLISQGLLKYGYSNFSLEILEYCLAEKIIEREHGGPSDSLSRPLKARV